MNESYVPGLRSLFRLGWSSWLGGTDSRLAFGCGRRALPLEEGLGTGKKLAETLLFLLFSGRRGPGLCRRTHVD